MGSEAAPLMRVVRGVGNGAGSPVDGVVQGSVLGTYMHGPALARNPELADYLLSRAIGRELEPLELSDVALLRRERLRR